MADAAIRSAPIRTAPVPTEPASFPGVTISLGEPMARWSLRARDAGKLAEVLGRTVPGKIGETADGMACLGPDEWLLRLPAGSTIASGEGQPVSVVDISERSVCIVLEGEAAIDVLASGCPRDISRFPVGYSSRTIYETVEILIHRESETRFAVDVWRSFAPWLWTALTTAASHG